MKPVILITRAIEHSRQTQTDVQALGADTLLDGLLTIVPIENAEPISATTGALIITSRNALQGLKNLKNIDELPVFVVGKETAALCAAAGFKTIRGIAEQSNELPKLIMAAQSPHAGALLHVTSEHAHTDFYDALLDAGYGIEQRLVYAANAASQFNAATLTALQQGTLWGVLFYSARTAQIFNGLVASAGFESKLGRLNACCLSDAIASTLDKAKWKAVVASKSPTHASLMDTLRDCLAKPA